MLSQQGDVGTRDVTNQGEPQPINALGGVRSSPPNFPPSITTTAAVIITGTTLVGPRLARAAGAERANGTQAQDCKVEPVEQSSR